MLALYRDPQGKKIFGKQGAETTETTQKVTLQAERSRVVALEKEIHSLQSMLKQQQEVSKRSRWCHTHVNRFRNDSVAERERETERKGGR